MADIGRSTNAHEIDSISLRETDRLLRNWGAWNASIAMPGPSMLIVQPMFKDYVDNYRKTKPRPVIECHETAEVTDKIIAQMGVRDRYCLICDFVMGLSLSQSSTLLTRVHESNKNKHDSPPVKLSCSKSTYQRWLVKAVDNACDDLLFINNVKIP